MLEIVENWLKGLSANKNTGELKTGKYKDQDVFIHKETNKYTLISYTKEGGGIFSVDNHEINS